MATGLDIIKGALRKIGALTKSEAPDGDEAQDALNALNAILSSWSNEANKVYARTTETFNTVTNTASYTIGTGATFNTSRPIKIISAYTRNGGSDDYPVDIITDENYAIICQKAVNGRPYYLNYTTSYPNGVIKLWPVPDKVYPLTLVSEKELSSVTLAGDVAFPPGWERALTYALAVDLAPEYGQPVDQALYSVAQDAIAKIEAGIMRTRSMDQVNQLSVWNIFTGYNQR
jgi:hypothetical protein